MNILYIIEELELGGAERVVSDLARSLDRSRFNVKVCCLREKGVFAPELEKDNIEIIALHKKPGLDISIISKVIRLIKDHDIHVVHTHLWVANFWGRLAAIMAGVPVVVTEHNVDVWKKWHHKLIDRMLAPFTKTICVVSNQVKQFYQNEVGISANKLEVVYNGIDLNVVPASDEELARIKNELHIPSDVPVLANIGRLVPAKANHIFIESLETLDRKEAPFCALIIGDGPLKSELTERGKDLVNKGKLVFTGLRKDVPKLIDLSTISVLSSTREGFSIIVLESMVKGIPFVATDVGGNSEQIINGETGFLVPKNNPEALAVAMEKILTDPALIERMSRASRKRIEDHFSLEIMTRNTEEIYQRIS